MWKNKLQFQKGLSITEFMSLYGTEEQCESAVEQARWIKGYVCPKCGKTTFCIVYHGKNKTYQCNHCHNQTTLTAGTIFQDTKLPLTLWFYAIYILTQAKNNVSGLELSRTLGIGYRSAWRMKHKIIEVMFERENKRKLSGRIEIDDAYLGGEKTGEKVGRGSPNKVPFIAAVQTDADHHPKYIVLSKVKAFTLDEVEKWSTKSLETGSTVISDGFRCFSAVKKSGCKHKPHVVGSGKRSTDLRCFQWVNTILGNLKTAMSGTYHAFKFDKYAHRYLGEVQYRFNRRFEMKDMFIRMVYATVQTGARPERWLRAV
jgi:transposase-like protein